MNLSTPKGLLVIVLFMFAFGFMLVPLYDVICEVTGLNGKTAGKYEGELASGVEKKGRTVTIQFVVNKNANLPWEFKPTDTALTVSTGERRHTAYQVTNSYQHNVVAQAVPSVAPAAAAEYVHKIECFCFEEQPLAAGETKNMPLTFVIDPDLPVDITKLTLSYTLFDITDKAEKESVPHQENKVGI